MNRNLRMGIIRMNLGAFSISLSVKDLQKSIEFYEKLGFVQFGGDCGQGWTILKNGDHIIGLFQGMFEKNMLTFNPGWDQDAQPLKSFEDIRILKKRLKAQGIVIGEDVELKTRWDKNFKKGFSPDAIHFDNKANIDAVVLR